MGVTQTIMRATYKMVRAKIKTMERSSSNTRNTTQECTLQEWNTTTTQRTIKQAQLNQQDQARRQPYQTQNIIWDEIQI